MSDSLSVDWRQRLIDASPDDEGRVALLVVDELEDLRLENERLRTNVNAMCGWAEILAEKARWTRDNAQSYWRSYEAARRIGRGKR